MNAQVMSRLVLTEGSERNAAALWTRVDEFQEIIQATTFLHALSLHCQHHQYRRKRTAG